MRVSSITSNIGQIANTSSKKPISSELKDYLDNYSSDNFNHSNKEEPKTKASNLKDHQALFRFETTPDKYVSNIFNDIELIDEIKYMLNDQNSYDILDSFEKLIDKDKIKFGTHNENSLGFVSYNKNDVENTDIFITIDQSLLGVITTVVHEITHYNDLNNIASQSIQSTNSYDLEVNAFAKEYQFLKDNNFIEDESYKNLSTLEKNIYQYAYEIKHKSSEDIYSKNSMIEALEDIGYERGELLSNELVSNKDIELNRQIMSPLKF